MIIAHVVYVRSDTLFYIWLVHIKGSGKGEERGDFFSFLSSLPPPTTSFSSNGCKHPPSIWEDLSRRSFLLVFLFLPSLPSLPSPTCIAPSGVYVWHDSTHFPSRLAVIEFGRRSHDNYVHAPVHAFCHKIWRFCFLFSVRKFCVESASPCLLPSGANWICWVPHYLSVLFRIVRFDNGRLPRCWERRIYCMMLLFIIYENMLNYFVGNGWGCIGHLCLATSS